MEQFIWEKKKLRKWQRKACKSDERNASPKTSSVFNEETAPISLLIN